MWVWQNRENHDGSGSSLSSTTLGSCGLECFHLKALVSNAYVVLLKTQTYDRASNTRDTKAWWAADAIFPDSSTHCLLLKVYSLPQKAVSSMGLFLPAVHSQGEDDPAPSLHWPWDVSHPDFMNSMDCFSENLTCHPISSIFFNIFCLSNRRGHYGKTIKLQVKAAYTVSQRLYKRRMGTTKCWNNLYLQGASRGAELSVAITEAAPWPLCSLIYVWQHTDLGILPL